MPMTEEPPLMRIEGLTKSFVNVLVLRGIDLVIDISGPDGKRQCTFWEACKSLH